MASTLPSSILNEPLSAPPPGETSNFAHPPSRASDIYITAGICVTLILLFAALRIYARLAIMNNKKSWDDLTCMLGLVAGLSFIATTVAAVGGGSYGLHQWDITVAGFTKEQLLVLSLLSLLVESIYGPSIWFIKLSLFVLYLQLFSVLQWLRYLAFSGIIVTGLFYFASMISFIVLCGPKNGHSQFSYISGLASAECARTHSLSIMLGAVNVVSDLYLILLPLPAVWSLNLPFRKKVGVSAMFFTGSIACLASILGLMYRIEEFRTTDNTWAVIPVWTTTIVEIAAGILVCCMPTTNAAFKRIKTPVSSFMATYRRTGRLLSSSAATGRRESMSSSSNLRPMHEMGNYPRNDVNSNTAKVWPGSQDNPGKWQSGHGADPDIPLEGTSIRKTTEISVARKLQDRQAQ